MSGLSRGALPLTIGLTEDLTRLEPETRHQIRRLGELADLFADPAAARTDPDRIIYQTSTAPGPQADGHLGVCLTWISPGTVAGELHMTHGHIHLRPDGEVYLGQSGSGGVLLARNGDIRWQPLTAGQACVIPPGWVHRSVNTGDVEFTFWSIYPAQSGTDYAAVRADGLGARVLRIGSTYRVVDDAGRMLLEAPVTHG